MRKISFLILALVFGLQGLTQNTRPVLQPASPASAGFSVERIQRIDKAINEWIKDERLNGTVAMIVRNGKIVYHKAFGYDDLQKTKPLRTDDIFRIASQTKAVTSVALMMLYEEGKFLLDDAVSGYIPEFAKQQVLDKFNAADSSYTTLPAKSEITIRQLLTHTSGISYPQIGTTEANALYAKSKLHSGIGPENGRLLGNDVRIMAKLPLMHQPGEKFTYGFNTDIIGYLVEIFSGMNLDQFLKTRLFDPLGMKDSYFYLPSSKQNRLVSLYREENKKLVVPGQQINHNGVFFVDYPKMPGTFFSGGAGLSSTVMDYAIFLQMLLNGGTYNGKQILSRHTVRIMTMNQIGEISRGFNKFGLGFGLTTETGSSQLPVPEGTFEWGGAFQTTYWADPKEKIIGILYRQVWGSTFGAIANKFKVMVYSALND